MKTFNQSHLDNLPDELVYHNDFESKQSVSSSFRHTLTENQIVLYADYTYKNYSGSAMVLFIENGQLYYVGGSHCSCYGLENQWEPETVSEAELVHWVTNGSYSNEMFRNLLIYRFFAKLQAEGKDFANDSANAKTIVHLNDSRIYFVELRNTTDDQYELVIGNRRVVNDVIVDLDFDLYDDVVIEFSLT